MSLEAARERARANRKRLGYATEAERIASLQKLEWDTQQRKALVEKWAAKLTRYPEARKPRPIQAMVFESAEWAAQQDDPIGVVGDIGTGLGKTLSLLNLPRIFQEHGHAARPILILPKPLRDQFLKDAFEWANEYGFAYRANGTYNVVPYLHVLTYGELSSPKSSDLLTRLRPTFIACDEAHALRNPKAARTRRFLRYMEANPHVRFAPFSGTFRGKSVTHYAHLCHLALRQHTPLPRHKEELDAFSAVLDVDGEPDEAAWRRVRGLGGEVGDAARACDVNATRVAFSRVFASAAGVISSSHEAVGVPLVLRPVQFDISPELQETLSHTAKTGELPNGDLAIDGLRTSAACRQLSMGFFYYWDWPGDPDEAWLEARRNWAAACRNWLEHNAFEKCDSPSLLERRLMTTEMGFDWPGLKAALDRWNLQRHKDEPPTATQWIDPGPVIEAVRRAEQGTLIWFQSRAVGEMLQAMGVPVYWDGTDPVPGETAALSIAVYATGKNYQWSWHKNLILEVPSYDRLEQLVARTHRPGQTKTVTVEVFQHTWPLRQRWQRALEAASYAQGMGEPQKILGSEAEMEGRW